MSGFDSDLWPEDEDDDYVEQLCQKAKVFYLSFSKKYDPKNSL